eukprot:TRINITY_DN1216_c0_g1_i1.p1 TRINITY_DN1216_c0_g1~~TRINITY_DN1216_c0_g1_i1.p1  ORF type:complete len:266 (-),score=71.34 TRINITY_DN1216_c0_g1_i1:55-852(-)
MATTTTTTQIPMANLAKVVDVTDAGTYPVATPTNQVTSQIFLSPIAAPGILGFYSFAVPAVILGVRWAQWYGTAATAVYLWPALLVFGLVQLLCALVSYHARDNLATGFHGIWGAAFGALGIYYMYAAYGVLPILLDGAKSDEIGIWFALLAAISFSLFLGSFAQSLGTVFTTGVTTAASILAAIAFCHGSYGALKAAGWLLFFAGIFAFYTASAWLLEYQFMRAILPLNNYNLYNNVAFLNRGMLFDPVVVNRGFGEPGVMKGQ